MNTKDMSPRTVACRFCDRQTEATGTRLCPSCWEIRKQLDHITDITLTEEGRQVVMTACVRTLRRLDPIFFATLTPPPPTT